jgi:hypothetical protein
LRLFVSAVKDLHGFVRNIFSPMITLFAYAHHKRLTGHRQDCLMCLYRSGVYSDGITFIHFFFVRILLLPCPHQRIPICPRDKLKTNDRVCSSLTVCTSAEFQTVAPTTTLDRKCQALTVCSEVQVRETLNTQHCTHSTTHTTLHTLRCTRNAAHATLHTQHCTHNTTHVTRNTAHTTLHTQHCTHNTTRTALHTQWLLTKCTDWRRTRWRCGVCAAV